MLQHHGANILSRPVNRGAKLELQMMLKSTEDKSGRRDASVKHVSRISVETAANTSTDNPLTRSLEKKEGNS